MALSANVTSAKAQAKYGSIQTYRVAEDSGTIYRGAIVVVRLADATDAYAGVYTLYRGVWPAILDATDAQKQFVLGIAQEKKTADNLIRIRQDGKIRLAISNADRTMVGKLACITDDETVQLYTASGASNVVVGRISEIIDTTAVFVDFTDRPVRVATGAYD